MKKILVLGTGNAQTDFIGFCKVFGLEVHSCSYKNEGRGIVQSDYFSIINITDHQTVRKYAQEHNIDLIYSTGSELAMQTIAQASENLSLPVFIDNQTATTCTNKHLMRAALDNLPQYTVKHMAVKSKHETSRWSKFPAIVKPDDSQGQRGITVVKKPSELETAYRNAINYSRSSTVIIEEFIDGFEISANTYVVNGQPKIAFFTKRISFNEYPGGIIKRHEYPVSEGLDKDQIYHLLHAVLMKLGIRNGPAYLQLIVNKEGNLKVLEVTPRLDGCHLWRLILYIHNMNLFEILLNHLLTGKAKDEWFHNKHLNNAIQAASLEFFTQPPASKMQKKMHKVYQNAVYVEWYYDDNEIILPINGFAEKVGYQICIES